MAEAHQKRRYLALRVTLLYKIQEIKEHFFMLACLLKFPGLNLFSDVPSEHKD